MTRHALFLLLVVGAALGFSWLLVPRDQELALIHFKTRSYGDALERFERIYFRDDTLSTTAVPLSRLYQRQGEIDGAVNVVRRLLEERPRDIEALDLALSVYRDAMRPDDYLAVLARRVAVAPSAGLVRELAAIYGFRGNLQGETETLALLVADGNAAPQEFHRLLRTRLAAGDRAGAVVTLDEHLASQLSALTVAMLGTVVAIYVDADRENAAGAAIAGWFQAQDSERAVFAGLALLRRENLLRRHAGPLLEQLRRRPARRRSLLPAVHEISVAAGRPEAFREYVDQTMAAASSPAGKLAVALDAANLSGELESLEKLVRDVHLLRATGAAGRQVLDLVADLGDPPLARDTLRHLEARQLARDPLGHARVAMLAGDRQRAAAALATVRFESLDSNRDRLYYVGVLSGLGQRARALTLLEQLVADVSETPDLAADVARAYHDIDAHAAGHAALAPVLARIGSPRALRAAALLALGAGEVHAAVDWLTRQPAREAAPPLDFMARFAALVRMRGDAPLMQALRTHLTARVAAGDAGPDLVDALASAGMHAEALALIPAVRDDSRWRELYRRVVIAAWRHGEPAERDIHAGSIDAFVAAALSREPVNTAENIALAYDLIEAGAHDAALPLVAALADNDHTTWFDTWRTSARRALAPDAPIDWLRRRLEATPAADPRFRDFAFALGDLAPGETLPYLAQAVMAANSDEAVRVAAYYDLRDLALAQGQRAWLLTQLDAWLGDSGYRGELADAWLYDFGELATAARSLVHLGNALAVATPAQRETRLYALHEAALAAGEPRAVVPVIDAVLAAAAAAPDPGDDFERAAAFVLSDIADPAAGAIFAREAARAPTLWAQPWLEWLVTHDRAPDAGALDRFAARFADDERLDRRQRRALADRLLEAGSKAAAIRLLKPLAASAPPDSIAARNLFYLWGPRPGADAAAWISARAASARGRERIAWANELERIGAGTAALALLRAAAQRADADPLLLDACFAALLKSSGRDAARAWLATLLAQEPGFDVLDWIASTAGDADLDQLAVRAREQQLARWPNTPRALRELGLAAFDAGRRGETEDYLRHYLALVDSDADAHYYYAEVLSEAGFADRAQRHYRRVLELFAERTHLDFYARTLHAQSLHRLGQEQAALAAFEALLDERPEAGHVRADYVTMLLDNQRLRSARRVLAARGGQ